MTPSIQKPTVLHLTDYGAPYAGNFIASLCALETLVVERGGSVAYVLPPRARERVWTKDFSQSHEVHFLEAGGFLSYYRQVRRYLVETNASILHEHFIHFSEKLAAWLAIQTCGHRVKTVLHLHNHIELPKSAIKRIPHMLYFRSVSRFVCCSESVAAHLIADGVPKARVSVAENAIAFARLDHYDDSVRASLRLPEGTFLALMFGYNFEVKGVDLAVEAVRLLREQGGSPVVLAVALSSNLELVRARILSQLGASDLPDWILLLPPREDVGSYYRMADVFLSPSRQEGFCYALVEAAYCRTPVLASAIDAQKDLALPQEAFFPPQDSISLSRAISRVIHETDTPQHRISLVQTADLVAQTYSLSRWAERVCAAYDGV